MANSKAPLLLAAMHFSPMKCIIYHGIKLALFYFIFYFILTNMVLLNKNDDDDDDDDVEFY